MEEENPTPGPTRLGSFLALVVTGGLIASTLVYQGYHAVIAFDPNDTNHLETTLILITARQLDDGPATLYGPFSGEQPLVLIHAPLYYRVAGLLAWPMTRAGLDPIVAAMAAGRLLSFLGFLATAIAAGRIAMRGGGSRLVGLWAGLLVASSPILGSFGVTVRPDTLGLAFLATGLAMGLKALDAGPAARGTTLLGCGVALGLVACTKQHFLVAAGVLSLRFLGAMARGRLPRGRTALALVVGLAIPAGYFAWEQSVTGGRMGQSVFGMAARLREVAPGSPGYLGLVLYEIAKMTAGEIALATALLLAGGSGGARRDRLDGLLWFLLALDTAAMSVLILGSQGAWTNYAQPSVVWGSILLARGLGRAFASPRLPFRALGIAAAMFLLFAADVRLAGISYLNRREDARSIANVLTDPLVAATPADRRMFPTMSQGNRLYGRVALAHDEWLYEKYERIGMAEPRDKWVRAALTGPDGVWVVIIPSRDDGPSNHVPGVEPSLPRLGYRLHQQIGRYAVWARKPAR